MVLERALITVKPGQAEAFKQAFAKARPHIEGLKGLPQGGDAPGHRTSRRLPAAGVVGQRWKTTMSGSVKFPAFTEWRAILGPLFAAPPAVVHHHEPL